MGRSTQFGPWPEVRGKMERALSLFAGGDTLTRACRSQHLHLGTLHKWARLAIDGDPRVEWLRVCVEKLPNAAYCDHCGRVVGFRFRDMLRHEEGEERALVLCSETCTEQWLAGFE